MLFKTSCTHLTVTTWIKEMLLPTLRPQSLIAMDNAPFHNKPKIAGILTGHGHQLLPLPRYSPDFNPIRKSLRYPQTTEKLLREIRGRVNIVTFLT